MIEALNVKERDLLARVKAKDELGLYFFRKAKGLKWFDALDEAGYFDPSNNPEPYPSKKEGYYIVPLWHAIDYLVATSPELLADENKEYAGRVLEIIRAVTQRSIAEAGTTENKNVGNYRTWWQFSKIIQNIPVEIIDLEDLKYVDHWLNDKVGRGPSLVAEELGEKWLAALLDQSQDKAKELAAELLRLLYKTSPPIEDHGSMVRENGANMYRKAEFRFDAYRAERITKTVAAKSGRVLGEAAVRVFADELLEAVDMDRRQWSSLWQPAIERHEQNQYRTDAENWLVIALRESIDAWVREEPQKATSYIAELLGSESNILKRIAIHAIRENYGLLREIVDEVIREDHFNDDLIHEMWHLLHERYPHFHQQLKELVQKTINKQQVMGDDNSLSEVRTAYWKARWLAALQQHDDMLRAMYQECVKNAGAEPDHPDFNTYASGGWVDHQSALPADKMLTMATDQLVDFLDSYEDPGRFVNPNQMGLLKALETAVKANPLQFAPCLKEFARLDGPYLYTLTRAYKDLWTAKRKLPWDAIWGHLLDFCKAVVSRYELWSPVESVEHEQGVTNSRHVVESIGRLIEEGGRTDDHAFSTELNEQARELLLSILKKQPGREFAHDEDPVFLAINSPRGHCLQALINLALRSCRLAENEGGDSDIAWNEYESVFKEELGRADNGEYEFITLLTYRLLNFLYMSREWVLGNLETIFDQENYQKWLCAMSGYAQVSRVYDEIYDHLKDHGHFMKALGDKKLKDNVKDKVVQNIVVGYLRERESLDDADSLIRQVIKRAEPSELSHLIWFTWTLRDREDEALCEKVTKLWPMLLEVIDTESYEGKKLASKLATWAAFVTTIDDSNRKPIMQTARCWEVEYNSRELLELIARISERHPDEAIRLWKAMLQDTTPDYPEDAMKEALSNIAASGDDGRGEASYIAHEYSKAGNVGPSEWLEQMSG